MGSNPTPRTKQFQKSSLNWVFVPILGVMEFCNALQFSVMNEAISHLLRIKILELLSERATGFSELERELGIRSSGK